MFAIQSPSNPSSSLNAEPPVKNCTPNILPCRIHHDGPVENINRYWKPAPDEKNTQTAYFRGRRLQGRRVALPEGYQGVVATKTDNNLNQKRRNDSNNPENGGDGDGVDAGSEKPVKIFEKQAAFDELMVWGHEEVPAADDHFVRGVEEWVKFAEAMHSSMTSSGQHEENKS